MPEILLAAGTTPASSEDFTVAAGDISIFRLYAHVSGSIPPGTSVALEYKTGSVYIKYLSLTWDQPLFSLKGSQTEDTIWRVTRENAEFPIGVERV